MLETAQKSKQRVEKFFDEKNVQQAKLNTDEIKRIRTNFFGEETNGAEPSAFFPGFEKEPRKSQIGLDKNIMNNIYRLKICKTL